MQNINYKPYMAAGRKWFVQLYVLLSMKQKTWIISVIHKVLLLVKYQKRQKNEDQLFNSTENEV